MPQEGGEAPRNLRLLTCSTTRGQNFHPVSPSWRSTRCTVSARQFGGDGMLSEWEVPLEAFAAEMWPSTPTLTGC